VTDLLRTVSAHVTAPVATTVGGCAPSVIAPVRVLADLGLDRRVRRMRHRCSRATVLNRA